MQETIKECSGINDLDFSNPRFTKDPSDTKVHGRKKSRSSSSSKSGEKRVAEYQDPLEARVELQKKIIKDLLFEDVPVDKIAALVRCSVQDVIDELQKLELGE
jgi:hypothetical protein